MIRLVLADDRALLREGLQRILADVTDVRVVAQMAAGVDLLESMPAAADVVLLGVTGDWARAITLIPALRRARLKVLVLAPEPDAVRAARAVSAGAAGVLTMQSSPAGLVDAIRRVAAGRSPAGRASMPAPHDRPLPGLSGREYEVMRMLGSGQSVNDVAEKLGLSPKTIGTYRTRVLDKLGLSGTADLVRFVLERGLGVE